MYVNDTYVIRSWSELRKKGTQTLIRTHTHDEDIISWRDHVLALQTLSKYGTRPEQSKARRWTEQSDFNWMSAWAHAHFVSPSEPYKSNEMESSFSEQNSFIEEKNLRQDVLQMESAKNMK